MSNSPHLLIVFFLYNDNEYFPPTRRLFTGSNQQKIVRRLQNLTFFFSSRVNSYFHVSARRAFNTFSLSYAIIWAIHFPEFGCSAGQLQHLKTHHVSSKSKHWTMC